MKKIYLNLTGQTASDYQLQWSADKLNWEKVTATNPSTEINPEEEIDWEADDTIEKLHIKFRKQNIISNSDLRGNDTRSVKGNAKKGAYAEQDSYTIKVKPANGGPTEEYDPEIYTPPKS